MTSGTVSAASKRIEVFLQPGEYCVGGAAHRIRTVLGSCVSVTLWDPASRVGAMSHFLLATRGVRSRRIDDVHGLGLRALDARYGDEALRLMLHDLAARKVVPTACHAKIFGGGNMFPQEHADGATAIGRRNGEAARGLLHQHGIEIVSESLFGDGHRQIAFDVETGHVWARQVSPPRASSGDRGRAPWP
jgi:chemotaxis protein CheD